MFNINFPKAVIFDMDGIIFDTEAIARRLWQEVFVQYGSSYTDEDYLKVIGRDMAATKQILLDDYGSELPIDEMFDVQDKMWQEETSKDAPPLKSGVFDILDYLSDRDIPCALGSSTYFDEVSQRLERSHLRHYFSVVVGGDCVTHAKPSPDIFLRCLEGLQAQNPQLKAEDCLVIEDSRNGLKAANNARIPAVMIPDLITPEDVDDDIDFVVFSSLSALLAELKKLTE